MITQKYIASLRRYYPDQVIGVYIMYSQSVALLTSGLPQPTLNILPLYFDL